MNGENLSELYPDYNRRPPSSNYKIDLERAESVWKRQFLSLTDLFSTKTEVDGKLVVAHTHMIGQSEGDLRVIAYNNFRKPDKKTDESQQKDLSRFILPGEFAVAIKHHCSKPKQKLLECMKLQCTHIQVAIGVDSEGKQGVISISNPQDYHKRRNHSRARIGLFGSVDYPSILIKPKFPEYFSPRLKRQYVDSIRTWLVIANTFSYFPGDGYNGGDPLATISVKDVKYLGDKLLAALTGDKTAKEWLRQPENMVYCAEMVHIGLNLGIHYPLNKAILGKKLYEMVRQELDSKNFLVRNKNPYTRRVRLQMAPETLQPISEYLNSSTEIPEDTAFDSMLAIQPFTMVDILEKYIQKTIPREQMGEAVAPLQAKLIEEVKPVFLKAMKIEGLGANSPKREEIELLFKEILRVVGQSYQNYQAYIKALEPVLQKAYHFVKQIEQTGGVINAFIPPHCFLIRATNSIEGKPGQGILGWQYLGHTLHNSLLKRQP
jgi:hypothetical protein